MTTKQQEVLERLQREFEVCNKRCLDQFVFHFSKFQDAIGTKIFRLTLHTLGEEVSSLPLRDVLRASEKLTQLSHFLKIAYVFQCFIIFGLFTVYYKVSFF